ncbi:MAG: hypothetical protein EBY48_09220 [Opitutae bacterium]|nr:hypothetical protein [Opitutae bacterium]
MQINMNKYILRIPIKAEAITRTRDDFEKQMSPWRYKETYAKNEKEARAEKKKDERAYLDRYTQAAQNAMRFAETDRRERNVKVEGHRKNLGLITAALKQTTLPRSLSQLI